MVTLALALATLLLSVPTLLRPAHPIHTTVLQLRWDARTGAIDGTLRIFADDLEAAARAARATPSAYVLARLELWSGGTRVPLQSCGERRGGEAVLLCLRGASASLRDARIRSTVLVDRHEDQVNIVRLDAARSVTVLLTREMPERALS